MKDPEHSIGLFLHIIGIIMIAGGFLAAYIVERRFWKQVATDIFKSSAILPLMKTLPIMIQLGVLLQVISGIIMLHSRTWKYWGDSWLTIKLILVTLAFTNGLMVGKRLGEKIRMQIFSPSPDKETLAVLKGKMKNFTFIQALLLFGILLLSTVFR